jgi:hypothetical protein
MTAKTEKWRPESSRQGCWGSNWSRESGIGKPGQECREGKLERTVVMVQYSRRKRE